LGRQVVFHPLAAKEARSAAAWYAERSVELAERFRAAVLDATQRIVDQVSVHQIETTEFRYVRLHRFPYRLIFCFDSETTARVIAVTHFRRRTGYWRRRKQ
jgi:plasmid stabilization system protein ParE